jgi:general secretion pathway protein A
MYYGHFGLHEAPFSIAVNPRYLYMSPRHRDALAHLLYGVGVGGGFALLTGEVGTGKTTINRCLLEQLPEGTDLAVVLNPALSAVELLATVCDEFGVTYPTGTDSLKTLTDALHHFLLANHQRQRRSVLLIDEAQHLDFAVLEQIRLLTNLETDAQKLLQIVLIGQPELGEKLARPELRQLNQRITARYNLQALSADETQAYIRHRLGIAGLPAGRDLFSASAVRLIHRLSEGIPRKINLLCDRALLGAYGQARHEVTSALVKIAAKEVLGESGQTNRQQGTRLSHRLVMTAALAITVLATIAMFLSMADSRKEAVPVADKTVESMALPAASAQSSTVTSTWLLPHSDTDKALWRLYSDTPLPPSLCDGQRHADLVCVSNRSAVWEPLMALDRPVILSMQTPERFSAATLLVAFEGRAAWVWTDIGLERVSLAELADSWLGGYRYLWQPPASWRGPLAVNDEGSEVSDVALLFARLDKQEEPLAQQRFNAPLEARVRLFQQAEGLEADGVVGEQTLLRLQQRLGSHLSAAASLQRLMALSGSADHPQRKR